MPYTFEDLAERERRRWMKPNAHLWIHPDAHRFMRPDAERFLRPGNKLDRYWERPEYQSPAMRAYAKPSAPGRVAGYAQDQSFAGAAAPVPKPGPLHGELLKLKSDLAALRVQLAVIRHENAIRKARGLSPLTEADEGWQIILRSLARYEDACRKAGFNPAQPRVPAGHPAGGQWTDADGAGDAGADWGRGGGSGTSGGINDPRILSDATPDNDWIPGARYAQNEIQKQYSVDLNDEEDRGGHTLRDHVGKSDSELLARMHVDRGEVGIYSYVRRRQGSFESRESANDFVNRTLEQNLSEVDAVAAGKKDEAFLTARFGYRTGREAYRESKDAEPVLRDTYEVGVYIHHDPRVSRGYRVHTAYPRNSSPR